VFAQHALGYLLSIALFPGFCLAQRDHHVDFYFSIISVPLLAMSRARRCAEWLSVVSSIGWVIVMTFWQKITGTNIKKKPEDR